jgi:hypothetical protein
VKEADIRCRRRSVEKKFEFGLTDPVTHDALHAQKRAGSALSE